MGDAGIVTPRRGPRHSGARGVERWFRPGARGAGRCLVFSAHQRPCQACPLRGGAVGRARPERSSGQEPTFARQRTGFRDTAPAPAQALPSHGLVWWRGRPSPASGCRVSRRDKGRPVWPAAGCPAEGLEEQEHGVLRMARRQPWARQARAAEERNARNIEGICLPWSRLPKPRCRRRGTGTAECTSIMSEGPALVRHWAPLSSPCWCHTGCTCRI